MRNKSGRARLAARDTHNPQAGVPTGGVHARELLLGGRTQLTTRQIEQLSRKAPPTQRAQLASLAECGILKKWRSYSEVVKEVCLRSSGRGEETPSHLVKDLPPLETWGYEEVVNRLKRAGGLIAKNVVDVPRLETTLTTELRHTLHDDLDFIVDCASLLRRCT